MLSQIQASDRVSLRLSVGYLYSARYNLYQLCMKLLLMLHILLFQFRDITLAQIIFVN